MTRPTFAVVVLGTALTLVALSACGGGGGKDDVYIESISPSSATFGDEIVIRGSGFTAEDNDIGFGLNGAPNDEGGDSFDTAFTSGVPSPDGKTLRFELEETMGACAFSRLDPDVACPAIGLGVEEGETQVAVFNRKGISNIVQFTREMTHAQSAEIEVRESPAYKRLTEELDRWIDDYFVPASKSEFAAASYGFTIGGPENGNLYIELNLRNIDPAGVAIPEEIEGYEVKVNATQVITSSN